MFATASSYKLFAFDIEAPVLGLRNDADEWPPRYASWNAAAAGR
jgi:hypothetical protein